MKTFNLDILTPYGLYGSYNDIELIQVQEKNGYLLGILADHVPLISQIEISTLKIRQQGKDFLYAVGGGILRIEKDKTYLLLDSIERADEIDLARAIESKKRAESRLNSMHEDIDTERAAQSLARALNRINVKNKILEQSE